jgi:hypothetical protein
MQKLSKLGITLAVAAAISGCAGIEYKSPNFDFSEIGWRTCDLKRISGAPLGGCEFWDSIYPKYPYGVRSYNMDPYFDSKKQSEVKK